jgi:molybdenum cofactor sulfurtransferase
MDGFAHEMTSALYGNPHSASGPSQLSATRIEDVRLGLLNFFNADPADFDLVFVANTTAGVRLVVEGMRSLPQGFLYAHHQACHTSLVGAREEARQSVCLDDDATTAWLKGKPTFGSQEDASATLVAYTAQSHMDGRRYPLSWSHELRDGSHPTLPRTYTLLDAASFASTSPLDLSDVNKAPDFTVLSLYKIFGFPDLGVLIVRRQAQSIFNHRKYFGGGTVDMVVCGKERWHAPKTGFLHERLEDGTLPFHNIIAADTALKTHKRLFGSMLDVRPHTSHLTRYLLTALSQLRHGNGKPVCVLYTNRHSDQSSESTGPVVAFNIQNRLGAWVSLTEFEKLANLKQIYVRTGGLCSPGGIADALGLEPWEMRKNFSAGFRCGAEDDIIGGKPTGVIRVSLGAMSTMSDVTKLIDFLQEYFVESDTPLTTSASQDLSTSLAPTGIAMRVKAITVYPIKSCGGFIVPAGYDWAVRPEGLAWDREWCLVHRGSGQALSQKRYPKMALLRPFLDFDNGVLRISYDEHEGIAVPLSANPQLFEANERQAPSRVCGEDFLPQVYASKEINSFFSTVLNVPCVLARFPPGGRNLSSRLSKARMQTYQQQHRRMPGAYYDNPSPPESDSDPDHSSSQSRRGKILLSNESPILLINTSSIDALNKEIQQRGSPPVDETAFRANIIIQPCDVANGSSEFPAYSEDTWSSVRIGKHNFKLLGACRRCQMVCVNQATGEKKQEPFSTLAKTRRFDGKVYFGTHMGHVPKDEMKTQEEQHPTIRVGDTVIAVGP